MLLQIVTSIKHTCMHIAFLLSSSHELTEAVMDTGTLEMWMSPHHVPVPAPASAWTLPPS